MGLVKISMTAAFGILIVWLFFGVNILSIGLPLIPFFILLLISGWCIGFLGSAILATKGRSVATVVWSFGWLLSPFSAVYAPLNELPAWIHPIAVCLPITYVLEAMRTLVITGLLRWDYLAKSVVLNVLYLVLTVCLFVLTLRRSRVKGLARLEIGQ